jgi:NADH-quinone oxidoreductase subunit L
LPAGERFLLDERGALVSIGAIKMGATLALDPLAATFVLAITLAGALVQVYAMTFMNGRAGLPRYFCCVDLCVAATLLLVLADNFLLMLVGWEGLGLCSYLLIGFHYGERKNTDAARQAFIVNHVGDMGLFAGVALLFWGLGGVSAPGAAGAGTPRMVTADVKGGAAIELRTIGDRASEASVREVPVGPTLVFREIADQLTLADSYGRRPFAHALAGQRIWGVPLLLLACLGLFLGAAAKSAQVPFQGWLPDSSVAPIPAAALLQAATSVVAGVYLVARFGFLFSLSPGALAVVAVAGALTAVLGAAGALTQYDLPRLLAFSTISQMGFVFLAMGLGAFSAGVFHLVTHAGIQMCLVLAAGSVIRGLGGLDEDGGGASTPTGDPRRLPRPGDPQDLRNMGGVAPLMPITHRVYLVASLALAGFPVASAFYSRDAILWSALRAPGAPILHGLLWAVGFAAAGLTALYAGRAYYLVFQCRPPSPERRAGLREAPPQMAAVMAALAASSVLVGPLGGWPAAWGGHPSLARFLAPSLGVARGAIPSDTRTGHVLEWGLQLAAVGVALLGWWAARACFANLAQTRPFLERLRARLDRPQALAQQQLGIEALYRELGAMPAADFSRAAAWVDRRALEPTLEGLARGFVRLARRADGAASWRSSVGPTGPAAADGRRVRRRELRISDRAFALLSGVVALAVLSWLLLR